MSWVSSSELTSACKARGSLSLEINPARQHETRGSFNGSNFIK